MLTIRRPSDPKVFSLTILQLSSADPTAERTIHTLRSSNLQFYNAVWDAAKASTGLLTFNKRFYWAVPPTRGSKRVGRPKKQCALVDVVTQGGLEWVKVSTVTETRLLFEQAKAGWENANSSSNEDSSIDDDDCSPRTDHSLSNSPSPSTNPIELVRLAIDLKTASLATQIRYKHPAVRIVLPKIPIAPSPSTIAILDRILATGAAVEIGPSLSEYPHNPCLPLSESAPAALPLSTIFPKLIPNLYSSLTTTLNIDCTILLALISDLSHSPKTPHSPSHHKAITRQIELEARDHLLPECLYPALEGKDMVCTAEAATRMREIVEQIGTETERIRATLLFNDEDAASIYASPSPSNQSLLSLFAAQSEYPVPPDLRLPISIKSTSTTELLQHLPLIAQKVAEELSPINRSVFLYGWAKGITTMSSNRAVSKVVEGIVSGELTKHDELEGGLENGRETVAGPDVWICGTARSLVGKEKMRRG